VPGRRLEGDQVDLGGCRLVLNAGLVLIVGIVIFEKLPEAEP